MKTIVLLHGLGAHGLTLRPMQNFLRKAFPHFNIVSVSSSTFFNTFRSIVKDVVSEILYQTPPNHNIIIIGHSLGGIVARQISVLLGKRVEGIISIGSPHAGAILADRVIRILPFVQHLSPITKELTVESKTFYNIEENVPHFHILGNRKINWLNPVSFLTYFLLRDQVNHDSVVQWPIDIDVCRIDGVKIVDEDHVSIIYSNDVYTAITYFITIIGEMYDTSCTA